jgi:hypothetical protein
VFVGDDARRQRTEEKKNCCWSDAEKAVVWSNIMLDGSRRQEWLLLKRH